MGDGGGVDVMQLKSYDANVVDMLCQIGALEQSSSEFGETLVVVKPEALAWAPASVVNEPCHMFRLPLLDPLATSSKVELALALVVEGWKFEDEPGERLLPDSPKLASVRMLNKSAAYFQTLLLLHSMWEKRAPFILQHMTAGYYRCCLHLQSLDALHRREDLLLLREQHFGVLLAGGELPLLEGAARDEALAVMDVEADDEAAEHGLALVVPAPPMPPHIADLPPGAERPPAPHEAEVIRCDGVAVHIDGCLHASGIQRGWVKCRNVHSHGNACFKYRQVTGFPSRKDCAAWLLAWECGGTSPAVPDKVTHKGFEPAPDAIRHFFALLP